MDALGGSLRNPLYVAAIANLAGAAIIGYYLWRPLPRAASASTAEVTLGGINTDALSSKTMMSKTVPDLYFIGEAVDVTGWLGGYNFQWAWSSGWAAAQALNSRA